MALCPNCGELSDVKRQLEETTAELAIVRAKLEDSQRLNFILEQYALALDNKLLILKAHNYQLGNDTMDVCNPAIRLKLVPHHDEISQRSDEDATDYSDANDFAGGLSDVDDETDISEVGKDDAMLSYSEESDESDWGSKNLPKRSTRSSNRDEHVSLSTSNRSSKSRREWNCDKCLFSTPIVTIFQKHIRTHNDYKPFACNISGCSKKFRGLQSMQHHKKQPHDIPPVEESNVVKSKARQPPPTDIPTFKCDLCDFSSFSTVRFTTHIRAEHPSYRPFKCDFEGCSKAYNKQALLFDHKRVHTGECPYVCKHSDCSMAFVSRKKMLQHNVKAHEGTLGDLSTSISFDGPSTSRDGQASGSGRLDSDEDECPSAFTKRVSMSETRINNGYILQKPQQGIRFAAKHVRKDVEGGVGKYECERCDYSTNFEKYFEKHAKEHPGYTKLFKCVFEGCGQTFSIGQSLKTHNRLHRGEKKFVCIAEDCGRAFHVKSYLNYHVFEHHRELSKRKPFVCPVEDCRKECFSQPYLNRHKKAAHNS